MEELELLIQSIRNGREPDSIKERRIELAIAEFQVKQAGESLLTNVGVPGEDAEDSLKARQALLQAVREAEEQRDIRQVALDRTIESDRIGGLPVAGSIEDFTAVPGRNLPSPIAGGLGLRPAPGETSIDVGKEIAARAGRTGEIDLPTGTIIRTGAEPQRQTPTQRGFVPSDSVVERGFVTSDSVVGPVPQKIAEPEPIGEIATFPIDIQSPKELAEIADTDFSRQLGQLVSTFASDKLGFVGEPELLSMTRGGGGLGEFLGPASQGGLDELQIQADIDGFLTLDDIIGQSQRGMAIPFGTLDPREDPSIPGIRAITGPVGTGIMGGITVSAISLTKQMINDPVMTTLGLVTAPAVITYMGLLEGAQNFVFPGTTLTDFQNQFFDFYGRMTYHEALEARRAFNGLLAATVFARGLGINGLGIPATRGLGGRGTATRFARVTEEGTIIAPLQTPAVTQLGRRGGPRRGIVHAFAQNARGTGLSRAEALAVGELRANQITGVAGLATFGFFAAEPGRRQEKAIGFALASIPLGLSFTAMQFMAGRAIGLNRMLARAAHTSQSRSARPLDTVTAPVPTVSTDTGAMPMGGEVSAPLETPIRTADVHSHPDFARRVPRDEAARTAATRQVQERESGLTGAEDPALSNAERTERRRAAQEERFAIDERRRTERREAERRAGPEVEEAVRGERPEERREAEERRGAPRDLIKDEINVELVQGIQESIQNSGIGRTEGQRVTSPEVAILIGEAKTRQEIENIIIESLRDTNLSAKMKADTAVELSEMMISTALRNRETLRGPGSSISDREGLRRAEDQLKDDLGEILLNFTEFLTEDAFSRVVSREFLNRLARATSEAERVVLIQEALRDTDLSQMPELFDSVIDRMSIAAQRAAERPGGAMGPLRDLDEALRIELADVAEMARGPVPVNVPADFIERVAKSTNQNQVREMVKRELMDQTEFPDVVRRELSNQISEVLFEILIRDRQERLTAERGVKVDIEATGEDLITMVREFGDAFFPPEFQERLLSNEFVKRVAEAKDRAELTDIFNEALKELELPGAPGEAKRTLIEMITKDIREKAVARSGGIVRPEQRGLQRRTGGRREGEPREERRGPSRPLAFQGTNQGNIARELVFSALRGANGDVTIARAMLRNAVRAMREAGNEIGALVQAEAVTLLEKLVPAGVEKIADLEGVIIRERRGTNRVTQADVAAYEAAAMTAKELVQLEIDKIAERIRREDEILGKEIADEWRRLHDFIDTKATVEEAAVAGKRLREIEAELTPEDTETLAGIGVDRGDLFGAERFTIQEIRFLSHVAERNSHTSLKNDSVDRVASRILNEILNPKRTPEDTGSVQLAESTMVMRGGFKELIEHRGMTQEQVINLLADRYLKEITPIGDVRSKAFGLPEARRVIERQLAEIAGTQEKLESIPRRTEAPDLVPVDIAADLHNFIENGGDLVETLVGQVLLRDNQTVVISNLEVPTEVFLAAARQLPPDITIAVHVKSDGTFDIMVGGEGSPINFSFLNKETGQIEFPWRDQFINDGFFRGQKVSFNGKDWEYLGFTADRKNILLWDPGLKETFPADASAIRRIKNVEFMNEFEIVAEAQRGLPERAMLRVREAQLANMYHYALEQAGDIIHRMSQGIEFNKGNWGVVKDKVDAVFDLIHSILDEFGFERDINQQISRNHIVKSNPNASSREIEALLRARREAGEITSDPASLTETEFAELQRLQQLSQEYADAHRQIPVVNDVQRIANDLAIALGEFRFVDARTLATELKNIINKGQRNWEDVATRTNRPSAKESLRGILSQEEIANYERLRREVRPPTAEAMEGRALTEENIRQELNSNGYELERNAASAWVVRDYQTGTEQFASTSLQEVRDFNNRSGQREDVVIDGNTPIDNDIPGGVTPPVEPPARPNEPMGFDKPTLFERIGESITAFLPQWFGAKDWYQGVDGVAGTNLMGEVLNPTLNTRRASTAAAEPWRQILKKIADAMEKAQVTPEEALQMFVRNETRSYDDLIGSHLEGLGPLRNRSATEAEINAANLLASYNIDSSRSLAFVRRKMDAIALEKRRGPVSQERIEEIHVELRDSMSLSPMEQAAAALFELLRVEDINTHSIGVITRIADAKRLETLSQVEYQVENNMRPEVVEFAREIDQMMQDMADLPNSPISDVQEIRGYMARYAQDQTADPSSINLGQPGQNRNIDFVNAMSRTGELDAYSKDPIASTARYINGFFNAMEIKGNSFNKALDNARTYVKQNFGEGTTPRAVADAYLSSVQGNIPAMSKWSEKIMTKFFNELGIKFLKGFKIRDLVDSYMAMTHAAYIGWRVGLAGRDLMQFTFSHYSRTGHGVGPTSGARTARALQLAVESKGEIAQQLKDSGDLPTLGITEFQTPDELLNSTLGRGLKKGPEFLRAMAESALVASQQRNAYEFSYRGTLLEGREFYGAALTRMVAEGIPKAEIYTDIKLDSFSRSTRRLFDELVVAERYTEAANMLAKQLARELVGEYGAGQHPWGWNTNLGRLVTQYGQWSSNASGLVLGGATRGSKATRLGFATRLGMSQAALFVTGRFFGINFSRWFLLPGLFFTGGPALQTANLLVKAVFGYGEEKDDARERLNRQYPEINLNSPTHSDLRSLFPGSYAMQDILFFMNAIERGEALAPTGARLFSIPIDRKQSVLDGGKIFQ